MLNSIAMGLLSVPWMAIGFGWALQHSHVIPAGGF